MKLNLKALVLIPAAIAALALATGCSSDDSSSTKCPSLSAEEMKQPYWKVTGTEGCAQFAVTDDANNKAPIIKVSEPFEVDKTQVHTLIPGTGPEVTPASTVDVYYVGVNGRTGEVFDSAYQRGSSTQFPASGVVPGFRDALVGQKVGSTVAVVIPPADGYGPQGGSGDGSIEADDTIVFALKIVGSKG